MARQYFQPPATYSVDSPDDAVWYPGDCRCPHDIITADYATAVLMLPLADHEHNRIGDEAACSSRSTVTPGRR